MATSISSIGVGSGLPLDTLLENLRLAENAPLAALASRTAAEKKRVSAYGSLKNVLESLSTAATTLGKSETFNALKTSVTGDTFSATAKAGAGAIAGSHQIFVEQLATAQVLASGRASDGHDAVAKDATGKVDITFTLSSGGSHTLSIDADASLQDIAQAINADADLEFSATLMNDGEGHRLIISSNETGEENTIKNIAVNASADGASDFDDLKNILEFTRNEPPAEGDGGVLDPTAMGESVAGRNAIITINGIKVSSQDNELEDAIEGITLTLTKRSTPDAAPDTLQVTRDDDATAAAVEEFVKAYNTLQNTIRSLTAYNIETQSGAALSGDSLARRVQTQMRSSINGLTANGLTLSSIGITTDPTSGDLKLDKTKLSEALANDRASVEELFISETGLSKSVTAAAEVFTKSDGLLKISQDGIEKSIRQLERQYEDMEMRIDQKMETYRKQFVQLDGFVAQMGGISSYLSQQLSMLGNLSNSSKK